MSLCIRLYIFRFVVGYNFCLSICLPKVASVSSVVRWGLVRAHFPRVSLQRTFPVMRYVSSYIGN